MKKYFSLIIICLLAACAEHPDVSSFNVIEMEEAIAQIPNKSIERTLDEIDTPQYLSELDPVEIRITNYGIFIVLQDRFGKESGFLWSQQLGSSQITSITSTGFMPEYIRVKDNLFTYKRSKSTTSNL